MNTIGVIGAMDSEVENLYSRMSNTTMRIIAGRQFLEGTLGGYPAVVVKSGIGKVAAAITAQILIDHFHVDALLNTGMAGGLDSRLAVKDLVIGTAAVQHDFNITAFGHARGFIEGANDQRPTAYTADRHLVERLLEVAPQVLPAPSKVITGLIASGDIFIDNSEMKQKLIRKFGAAAAEMEGAAIAQAAAANGVPFAILRTISDLAEHQASVSINELESYVGRLAGDITIALLESI